MTPQNSDRSYENFSSKNIVSNLIRTSFIYANEMNVSTLDGMEASFNEVKANNFTGLLDSKNVTYNEGSTGSIETRLYDKLRKVVSVTDFGAVGDGITDDTIAIQNAFNAVKSNGGYLIFPNCPIFYKITSQIGTSQTNASDLANNVTIEFQNCTIKWFGTNQVFGQGAIVVEGNNITLTGKLTLTSSIPIIWNADPTGQQTLTGLVVGGKGNRRLLPLIQYAVSGVFVDGITVTNFRDPFSVYGASNVVIKQCTVTDYLSTGILIDDCLSNIEVHSCRVERGYDDNFFARHYPNTPWALANTYVGDLRIHNNHFDKSFAKNCGVGGYSDVNIHHNWMGNSWFASLNVESYSGPWYDNSNRISINNNVIYQPARLFEPNNLSLPAVKRAPLGDTTLSVGISLREDLPATYPLLTVKNVDISNNIIYSPTTHAISASNTINVSIVGNVMIADRFVKNAVNYDTQGSAIWAEDCDSVSVCGGNRIEKSSSPSSIQWTTSYYFRGTIHTSNIRVIGNAVENYVNALFEALDTSNISQYLTYSGPSLNTTLVVNTITVPPNQSSILTTTLLGVIPGDIINVSGTPGFSPYVFLADVSSNNNVNITVINISGDTSSKSGTLYLQAQKIPHP